MHIGLYRQAAMKQVKPCNSVLYPPPLCDQKAAPAVLAWLFVCLFAYMHFVDTTLVHPQALQRIAASSGAHQEGTKRTPKGHQKDTSVRNYRLQSDHEPVTAGRGPSSGSAGDET
ncbi:hypothetical protein J3E69DRAFT_175355 [Trichoderma sp. SZMC 28015]